MADTNRRVSIIFEGEDRISNVIKGLGGNLDKFSQMATGIASPFASLADSILKVDAALVALAAGGLVYAFNKSKDFENASIELTKVMGDDVTASLKEAEAAALSMSTKYGISATEILDSTANFKQAGFTVAESMNLAEESIKLMVAGNIEAADASEYLVATLKGFEAPASESARLIDIMNFASNNYATSLSEVATGMAGISPIASAMGFSFEQTAGLIVPIVETFRSGNEAATALKTGLLKLTKDSSKVTDALAKIGVIQKDTNGVMRSGSDIYFDVAKSFQTLTQEQKLTFTQQAIGIDQAAKMLKVFDNLNIVVDIGTAKQRASGSALLELAARLASTEVVVERFKVGFENLAIAIGDEFKDSAKIAIAGGADIENALAQMVKKGSFAPVFEAFNEFSEEMGAYLRDIAQALPEAFENVNWEKFIDAFGELGGSITDLFGDLDLTKPGDLARAIQGAVDTIAGLINITAGMVESMKPVFNAISQAISGMNEEDAKSQKVFGNVLGVAKQIIAFGPKIVAALLIIEKSGASLMQVYNVIAGSVKYSFNSFQIAFDGLAMVIVKTLDGILAAAELVTFGGLDQRIKDSREELASWKNAIQDDLISQSGDAKDAIDQVGRGFGVAAEEIEKSEKSADSFAQTMKDTMDRSKVRVVDLGDELKNMAQFPIEPKVAVKADPNAIWITNKTLEDNFGKPIEEKLKVEADQKAIAKTKKAIKTVTKDIKSEADIIKESLKWKAQLDIEEVRANAQVLEAMFASLGQSVSGVSSAIGEIGNAFANLDMDDFMGRSFLEDVLEQQMEQQRDLIRAQVNLTDVQRQYLQAKLAALQSGEALIQVEADGLEPEIEAFMWKILEKIQIRAASEQSEFLLGI